MPNQIGLRAVVVGLPLLAAACLFDAHVDGGARERIRCKVQDDCPPDFVCREALLRCVPTSVVDNVAPVFAGEPTVTPRVAAAGVPVVVTFASSEALGAPPSVTLVDSRSAHPMIATSTDATTSFSFKYVATGEEPEGDAAILVDLVDPGGDASFGLLAGVVTLDFSAPNVVDGSVAITIAPPSSSLGATTTQLVVGGSVHVAFRVDDVAATASVVLRAHNAGSDVDVPNIPSIDGADAREFFLVDTGSIEANTYDVVATLSDVAGNTTTTASLGQVVVAEFVPSPCPVVDENGAHVCTDNDGDGHFGVDPACPTGDDCNDDDPLTHPGALEIPGDAFDNACAGVGDGVVDESVGIFVAPNGSPSAAGTRADPIDTLAHAAGMAASTSPPRAWVFMASGAYEEPSAGAVSVSIAGGFDAATWTRSSSSSSSSSTSRTHVTFTNAAPGCESDTALFLLGDAAVVDVDIDAPCIGTVLEATSGSVVVVRDVDIAAGSDPIDVEDSGLLVAARVSLSTTNPNFAALTVTGGGHAVVVRSRLEGAGDAVQCAGDVTVLQSVLEGSLSPFAGSSVHVLASAIVSNNSPFVGDAFTFDVEQSTFVGQNNNNLLDFSAGAVTSTIRLDDVAIANAPAFVIFAGGSEQISLDHVRFEQCLVQTDGPDLCVADVDAAACNFPGCAHASDVVDTGPLALDADGRPIAPSPLAVGGALAVGAPTSLAVDPDGNCRDLRAPGIGAFVAH